MPVVPGTDTGLTYMALKDEGQALQDQTGTAVVMTDADCVAVQIVDEYVVKFAETVLTSNKSGDRAGFLAMCFKARVFVNVAQDMIFARERQMHLLKHTPTYVHSS